LEDSERQPLVMRQPIVLRCPARLLHRTWDDAAPRQTSLALGDRLESRNVVVTLLKYGITGCRANPILPAWAEL
jgi:hypothetical protein